MKGSDWSEAFAVNERGHAAGHSDGHATLWRDGRIIDLGVLPGGLWSVATDLNDREEVVGYSSASGGTDSYAEGINNAGDVVGNNTVPGECPRHAVR